jgi:hypothetical protein
MSRALHDNPYMPIPASFRPAGRLPAGFFSRLIVSKFPILSKIRRGRPSIRSHTAELFDRLVQGELYPVRPELEVDALCFGGLLTLSSISRAVRPVRRFSF